MDQSIDEATRIADTYDVVIFGTNFLDCLERRMEKNLLTFRYCERLLKKGEWRRYIPSTRRKIYNGFTKYKNKRLYVLCAGSYMSRDLTLCGFDKHKCFKWGYFPDSIEQESDRIFELKRRNTVPEILYAGRLIKCKRVLDSVKAVNKMAKNGINCHYSIIGEGECLPEILQYVERNNLKDTVTVMPFMKPEQVREYMLRSDIYIHICMYCAVIAMKAGGR